MEPGDSGSRSSAHPVSAAIAEQHQRPQRVLTPPASYRPQQAHLDRRYREQPAMAAATVLTPISHYPAHSPLYPSYQQHQSGASVSAPAPAPPAASSSTSTGNMISSEQRRSPDDKEQSVRQSLPSISEVISGARPGHYPPSHPSMQPAGSGLPSPFPPTSRQFTEPEKHSPQPLHTSSSYPSRQENLPAFAESPRPPYNGRHSLPPVGDRRSTPPTKSELPPHHHRLNEAQPTSDPHTPNGAYVGHGHPPQSHTSHPYPPGHLPPGQVPLPIYPISPRHAGPPPPPPPPPPPAGQYDPRGPPMRHEEADYRARFELGPSRQFEAWNYQDSLSRIGTSSRTIFNFAEAYGRIAHEQHGSHPIPERLPTEREVHDMLTNVELLRQSLEQVKDAVLASIQSERAREGIKVKGSYEEDHPDVAMYENGMKAQYAMTEVKKRRGRAAPPGRCHSCNRIDTPEWRRGPDGARTLCNACGLHYAKLERKRQLEARSGRAKAEDRTS
ncbi:hypothetical protein E4U42_005869 [Claviceps africana]|uniref:GATA-type domain-containing protein n=1 Tax=Claviceps africana TaxID=83212 RepID=A0A8K0NJQ0_9HYPO|nr:hypothetical protein E4U42_005869 [Claviceps africana]